MREWGPSGRTPAEGYLPMTGVVANGAVDYPIAAQRNPLFVSGDDFDFTNYEGSFVRNLGGNAADEGVLQQDQQERSPNNPVGTQVNGGGGQTVRSVTTSNETRPVNVAEQLYLIVDTYLEVNAAGSVATPTGSVVHSIVQTDNIDDSTVGSKITIVTGTAVHLGTQEVAFETNGDITLPQQPQPYILKWYGGFDMDGDPDQETRVAFSGPTLYSLDATADAFDTTVEGSDDNSCLLYTSPSPRDATLSRMPSSA